jgi:hypothetical protein
MTKDRNFANLLHSSCANLNRQPQILEIGSGLGVCGLVAASLCSSESANFSSKNPGQIHTQDHISTIAQRHCVTLSDFVPVVLDNLKAAVVLNELSDFARVLCLDWAKEAGILGETSGNRWYAGNVSSHQVAAYDSLLDDELFDVILGSDGNVSCLAPLRACS